MALAKIVRTISGRVLVEASFAEPGPFDPAVRELVEADLGDCRGSELLRLGLVDALPPEVDPTIEFDSIRDQLIAELGDRPALRRFLGYLRKKLAETL